MQCDCLEAQIVGAIFLDLVHAGQRWKFPMLSWKMFVEPSSEQIPTEAEKQWKTNIWVNKSYKRFESMTSETPKPDRAILKLTPRNNSASISPVSIPASSSWISLGVASSKPISVGVATPCFTPDSEGRDQVSGSLRSLFAMAALSKSATEKEQISFQYVIDTLGCTKI